MLDYLQRTGGKYGDKIKATRGVVWRKAATSMHQKHLMLCFFESPRALDGFWGCGGGGWEELRGPEGTNASFGKSSLKLAREVANTPKVIALANTSCCFATSGTNTLGSKSSRRRNFIKWHIFPRLQCHAITFSCPSNVFRNDLKHNMKLSLSMFSEKQKVSCYL